MSDFKIIDETTLMYGNKDQLYLMIVRFKKEHFIVVDSRHCRIGKIQTRSRNEAEVIFSQISARMKTFTYLWQATDTFIQAFSLKSVREFMFIINVLNTEVEFNSIWKMRRTYGCMTTPINTDLIFEDKEYENKIHVTFPGNVEALGFFNAPDVDSKFTFFLNDHFLPKM